MRRFSIFQVSLVWFTAILFLAGGTGLSAALFFSSTTAQAATLEMALATGGTSCTGNLVSNPGFENDAVNTSPAGWSGSGKVIAEYGGFNTQDGTKFAYVTGNKSMWVTITPTVGKSYTATFYSGSHNPNPSQQVRLTLYDGASNILAQSIHTIVADMEDLGQFGGPYTLNIGPVPTGATQLRFEVTDGGYDYAKIDGVCLREGSGSPTATPTNTSVPPTATPTKTTVPPTATPTKTAVPPTATPTATANSTTCSANLISNPGFENDTINTHPADWYGSGWVAGEYNGFNTQDGVKFAYVTGNKWMWYSIPSTVGKSYQVSFYSGSHVPNPSQQVRLTFYNSSFTVLAQSVHTIVADMEVLGQFGGPYTLEIGPAPAGTSELRFEVTDGGNNYAKIDGVCLHETTTSSTATPTNTKTPVPPTATPTNTKVPPTATPTNTPVLCTGKITGLRLWNLDANSAVTGYDPIANGATLYLEDLPTNFNLEALTSGSIGSVKFDVNGATDYENAAPYRYTGDNEPWHPALVNYTVTATVYQNQNLGGVVCDSKNVSFTFTNRPTATPTNTKVPPTATPTNTTVPPTATPTNTKVPPTATPTNTKVPPTATPTNTTVPPTATPTNTKVPPTATPTNTKVPPTATPTNTNVPPTATPTNTKVPPTATPTNTNVPPTATPTNTTVPPTATPTNTKVPPTATPTNTNVPPTATPTNTTVPPTATPTNTKVPPTATPTNTTVPPTATPTSTNVPPTATPQLGSLGNQVWYDVNNSANQDSNPTYVPGVRVDLLQGCVGGTILETQITDNNGYYTFFSLEAGEYRVRFSNLPAGYQFTRKDQGVSDRTDSDANPDGFTDCITLAAGENNPTVDAGIVKLEPTATPTNTPLPPTATATNTPVPPTATPTNTVVAPTATPTHTPVAPTATPINTPVAVTASLGNYVWLDTNKDGIQDSQEKGVAGITVELLNAQSSTLVTTTTDTNGLYLFADLLPGDYSVRCLLPSQYVATKSNQGNDDELDSDVDPLTLQTEVTTLVAGENDMSWDCGIYLKSEVESPEAQAALGDLVWEDLNKNGNQDSEEKGIANVTVLLYNSQGQVISSTVTDSSGHYWFRNLTPASYVVEFVPPSGYLLTDSNIGDDTLDSDVAAENHRTPLVTLTAGQINPTLDAGFYPVPTSEEDSPELMLARIFLPVVQR